MFRNNKIEEEGLSKIYKDYNIELNRKRLHIAIPLSLFFVILFGLLDYIEYKEVAPKLIAVRSVANIFLIFLYVILAKGLVKKNIKYIGLSVVLIVYIMIDIMIFLTNGVSSPYYAGLTLTIVALAALLPWTLRDALFSFFAMISLYTVAIFSHYIANDLPSLDIDLSINNFFFLISTGVFCVVASYLNSSLRFKEFCLNYELEKKNKELKILNEMRSSFFANISHEFRTPLTLIAAPIDDLLNRTDAIPQNIRNILNIVNDNAMRLLKLVNDLLDIIKLEDGKTQLNTEIIEINNFISGISDSVAHLAKIQGIELTKKISNQKVFIKIDTRSLEKIVLNLLSNAIKFTKSGGKISISVISDERDAFIEVQDNGIGIEEKEVPYIFDRFKQVDNSDTRQYQGTGLGLSLVKELTELQGGSVSVTSCIGNGTNFRVSFPIISVDAARNDEVENESATNDDHCDKKFEENIPAIDEDHIVRINRAAQRYGLISKEINNNIPIEIRQNLKKEDISVLIIDDEPDMRRYIVDLIDRENYKILQATDGESGLKIAQEQMPDIIILDLMLPKIDGLNVCKILKKDKKTKSIKIILLTARTDEGAKITALRNGADDFVTKPFSSLEIKTRVNNLLEGSKLQKQLEEKNKDLTEAMNNLNLAQAQIIQNEKMVAIGSLSAGLLHEVNNPLNYVILALSILKQNKNIQEDPDLFDVMKDVDDGLARIRMIVSDLRAFAHPESSDKKNEFLIYNAIENSIRFTAKECENIERINNSPKDLMMTASQSHVVQVLINLISNGARAIAKTDRSDSKITIDAKRDGNSILVSVSDNGIGMDDETLKRVFDPFFTTSEVGKGMGLGLSVSHTIIKDHNGKFYATSEAGKGSTFYFSTPL
jgi:signal transduction histidine kinase